MASVSLRTGFLYFNFRYAGERCREYTKLEDTPANRRKMEGVLKRIETEISLGTFEYARFFPNSPKAAKFTGNSGHAVRTAPAPLPLPGQTPLFRDFAILWKGEKRVEWRQSYRDTVESIFKAHLLPALGELPIGRIDRERLLAFRAEVAGKNIGVGNGQIDRKLSATTVNRVMGILRMIIDEAVLRLGIANPFIKIKRLKQKKTDVAPFTIEQVCKVIDSVRPDYRSYLTTRFFTGVRSGEANGLKWKHVDFERRQLLIRETFSNGRTEYTKNDGSQREIEMSQVVHDSLKAQFAVTGKTSEYVFCTPHGHPINNKNFDRRVWRPLLRLLGYTDRRPYHIRHTCATLWLAAGENPNWIARQLGHVNTEMLFRIYARFVPNLTRKDGSAFDRLITSAVNGGVASSDSPATSAKEPAHG